MKLVPITVVAVAGLCLAANTASAQYPALVPHRGHYHVVPTYAPPVIAYSAPVYGNQVFSNPGVSFGGVYASPGISVGLNFGSGYGGGFGNSFGGFSGYGGHHHHHHGHYR